jgi:hypothetical protein
MLPLQVQILQQQLLKEKTTTVTHDIDMVPSPLSHIFNFMN